MVCLLNNAHFLFPQSTVALLRISGDAGAPFGFSHDDFSHLDSSRPTKKEKSPVIKDGP